MTIHHVIIGGGPAATAAIETIRQVETTRSQITWISDEPPHSRMAIPYWLADKISHQHTFTADDVSCRQLDIQTRFGIRVERLWDREQRISLSDGTTTDYDRLLIATGSKPQRLAIPGGNLPQVQPLWSLADGQQLLDRTRRLNRPRGVLVGAGFIGMIVLNALVRRGWDLTVVERESHILPEMLDVTAAQLVQQWLTERNVTVYPNRTAVAIHSQDAHCCVELNDDMKLAADLVVTGIGVRPNLELVHDTNVTTDSGILVDQHMQTNVPNIYAAGDVAQGSVLYNSQSAIHAIQPTAVDHGRVAGANMAGLEATYPGSLLVNVLDVCGLQCASMGDLNCEGRQTTVIWNPDQSIYRKMIWHDDRLAGVMLTGQARDAGMLTDIGMTKGLIQTGVAMGPWKRHLEQNPFDVRKPFIALRVADQLARTTLLGRPADMPAYRFQNVPPTTSRSPHHSVLLGAIHDANSN